MADAQPVSNNRSQREKLNSLSGALGKPLNHGTPMAWGLPRVEDPPEKFDSGEMWTNPIYCKERLTSTPGTTSILWQVCSIAIALLWFLTPTPPHRWGPSYRVDYHPPRQGVRPSVTLDAFKLKHTLKDAWKGKEKEIKGRNERKKERGREGGKEKEKGERKEGKKERKKKGGRERKRKKKKGRKEGRKEKREGKKEKERKKGGRKERKKGGRERKKEREGKKKRKRKEGKEGGRERKGEKEGKKKGKEGGKEKRGRKERREGKKGGKEGKKEGGRERKKERAKKGR
ncbi:Histone-lysine N-methyltransferase, H3 lysine-79 specific, partial [Ophiophagus hannah]